MEYKPLVSLKNFLRRIEHLLTSPTFFFTLFATIFGFLLVFITPPMQVPDEQSHFYQAYAVSNLDFVWDKFSVEGREGYGAKLPASIFDSSLEFLYPIAGNPNQKANLKLYTTHIAKPLNPNRTAYNMNGTSYSPLVYIPQVVGITIGKVFQTSPLIMIWLGRLANLAAWIAIVYLAIRIIPFGKWAVAVLALNPIVVFLSASLSADVMTIGLAFLFFSFLCAIIVGTHRTSKKNLALLSALLVGLSLTKPVMAIFGLLLLAIPWRYFKSKTRFALFLGGTFLIMLAAVLGWAMFTSEGTQASIQFQRPGIGIEPTIQLQHIVESPGRFIQLVVKNYILVQPGYFGDIVLPTMFGVFGWLDTGLPLWIIVLYLLILFTVLLYQLGRGANLGNYQKLLFLIVFVGFCTANVLAMYLVFTPVNQSIIDGVQGRYFIPAMILLVGFFSSQSKVLQLSRRQLSLAVGSGMLVVLLMMTLRIFTRYYIS